MLETALDFWAMQNGYVALAFAVLAALAALARWRWRGFTLAMLSAIAWGLDSASVHSAHLGLEALKRTPPAFEVGLLGLDGPTATVGFHPRNAVPFEVDVHFVNKDNVLISGLTLDWHRVLPVAGQRRYILQLTIDRGRVIDGILELRVHYRSAAAAELGYPEKLTGYIVQRYKIGDRGVSAIHMRPGYLKVLPVSPG